MKATVVCYKVTEEHALGELAELSTGDQHENNYVVLPEQSNILYLAIDGETVVYISTDELIRLVRFWEYGRMGSDERAARLRR